MKELNSLTECNFSESDNIVVALGFFDGLHLAHQRVISECVARAKALCGTAAVFTFQNHPTSILSPDCATQLLTPYPLKKMYMESLGVDCLIAIPFDIEISSLPPQNFIEEILVTRFHTKEIVVGYNFHFGANRDGTIESFQEQIPGIFDKVHIIKPQTFQNEVISSTLIRNTLLQGHLETAAQLLGHPYQLFGKIINGDGRGRSIGFPTANMETHGQIFPPNGVYGVQARIGALDKTAIQGVMNIGMVPTFLHEQRISVEVHLLDFHDDIYGQELIVDILLPIRNERKFASPQELVEQIKNDIHVFETWYKFRS
jgi:riboflavin kinase / FMN adenylyltransferase